MNAAETTQALIAASRLTEAYRPVGGAPDEMIGGDGAIRRLWRPIVQHLSALSLEETAFTFARGDQYLRDAGVYYRQYDEQGSTERSWPLSHIPVLIDESEWNNLTAGLVQRATLLELLARDVYGDNRLVAEGKLPPALIAENPHWLRPMVGAPMSDRNYLQFVAFDLGRGPDGAWWVIGDRLEAPSGAGFALENRVATARVFSALFSQANIHRLAGFFQSFKERLLSLRAETDSAIAILSPGLLNDTYFEHAYIARYLGFTLLEGGDLAVDNGRLKVRTVDGLAPISVLWRRLDARFADPLELDEDSALGVPGLAQIIREAPVQMINSLGVGALEVRAMLAFMPRLCRALLGEDLRIPNIATWWCGDNEARAYVRTHADNMILGPAYSTRPAFEHRDPIPSSSNAPAHLDASIVGQELVSLSTTPAFVDGQLQPRPMVLRVFLARTKDGWSVMPGGYARIGRTQDSSAIAMQQGGSAADVWVVSERPVKPVSLIASPQAPYRRAEVGVLSARAADNLFWLGRYVERAEGIIRRHRAYHLRLAESGAAESPVLDLLKANLAAAGVNAADPIPDALLRVIDSALSSAGQVRDRFSIDGWMALNDLRRTSGRMRDTSSPGDDAARAMSVLLRKMTGFAGLVHENMHRSGGWHFLSLGHSLERAIAACDSLAVFAHPDAPEGALDLCVEIGDSAMIHRRRYAIATLRAAVIDLLVFDAQNPRALLYHLSRMRSHFESLSGHKPEAGRMSELMRAFLKCETSLKMQTPESLNTAALWDARKDIAELSNLISLTYFR